MYVTLDQKYLTADKVIEVQNVAEETTKTTKGLLRFLYNKTQKRGKPSNTVAEPTAIYKTEGGSLDDNLFLDLPEEFINTLPAS